MSKVYFTSDWHLGHKAILKYRKEFKTIKEHDDTIFDNYKAEITKRDTVYFLGDMVFDKSYLPRIKELLGHKVLILGNHDSEYIKTELLLEVFDKVIAMKKHKGYWLTHAPIHTDELRGHFNIHGHTHAHCIDDSRYFNVCVDNTEYKPVPWEKFYAIRGEYLKQEELKTIEMNKKRLQKEREDNISQKSKFFRD